MVEVKVEIDGNPTVVKRFGSAVMGGLAILSILAWGYVAWKDWVSFLRTSAFLALPIAIGFYIVVVSEWRKGSRPRMTFTGIHSMVVGPAVMAYGIALGYYGYGVALFDAAALLFSSALPSFARTAIFSIFIGVLGIGLYLVRLKMRFFYGFTEAVAGLCIAAYHVYTAGGDPSKWGVNLYFALLTAGVYLIVRGLDNMQVGARIDRSGHRWITPVKDYFANLENRPTSDRAAKVVATIGLSEAFFGMRRPEKPEPRTPPRA